MSAEANERCKVVYVGKTMERNGFMLISWQLLKKWIWNGRERLWSDGSRIFFALNIFMRVQSNGQVSPSDDEWNSFRGKVNCFSSDVCSCSSYCDTSGHNSNQEWLSEQSFGWCQIRSINNVPTPSFFVRFNPFQYSSFPFSVHPVYLLLIMIVKTLKLNGVVNFHGYSYRGL